MKPDNLIFGPRACNLPRLLERVENLLLSRIPAFLRSPFFPLAILVVPLVGHRSNTGRGSGVGHVASADHTYTVQGQPLGTLVYCADFQRASGVWLFRVS